MSDKPWQQPGLTPLERARYCIDRDHDFNAVAILKSVLVEAIEAAVNEVVPTWTPVTDRFPEETGQYWLICQSSRDKRVWLDVARWDVAHPCPVAWCQRGAAYWIRAAGFEDLPDISADVDALGFKLQGLEVPMRPGPASGVLIGWDPMNTIPKEDGS